MSKRMENNQEIREKIIDALTKDDDGEFSAPRDPKMLSALDKLMSSSDRVEMHKERLQSDNNNSELDRQVSLAIAKGTSTQIMRTRHEGESSGEGPTALGNERNVSIDPATIEPLGESIDIDKITEMGRQATKGTDLQNKG